MVCKTVNKTIVSLLLVIYQQAITFKQILAFGYRIQNEFQMLSMPHHYFTDSIQG